jgi:aminoglycoside/choline kinase family phosphotransferase
MKQKNSKKDYTIIEEITTGGSERRFFRCKKDNKTYIIIRDNNIGDYVRLQKHLLKKNIGVPRLYRIDRKMNLALVEDLGKNTLYKLVTEKKKDILPLYQRAIRELTKLQVDGFENVPIAVYYDYKHIRWEQEYFKEFFLRQYCNLSNKKLRILDSDFEHLAQKLLSVAKPMSNFLMHRDYQSQNIHIKKNQIRIIDFQSARIGPPSYDLAALLKDAYVNITEALQNRLVQYYLTCMEKKHIVLEKKIFLESYRLTALQRNMQALGAFANLSLNKYKPRFKQYIPRGLILLQSGLKKSEFNKLYRIIASINYRNAF